jgi:DnaJ-class molecular chaperone
MYLLCPYCGGSGEFWSYDEEGERINDSCTGCQGAGFVPENWLQDYDDCQLIADSEVYDRFPNPPFK